MSLQGDRQLLDTELNDVEHHNLVWGYPYPLPESMGVAGMVCFYNEKVDMVIDGVPQERPPPSAENRYCRTLASSRSISR